MMKRSLTVAALVITTCAAVAAQTPVSAPRAYDPSTEVTYGGIVTGVVATGGPDGTVGVHLDLATGRGSSVRVYLGPAMFIGMNDSSFIAEDQVLVTGAFVTHAGEVALWARTITKNDKTLTLRGPDGTPRWPFATARRSRRLRHHARARSLTRVSGDLMRACTLGHPRHPDYSHHSLRHT